MRARSAIFDVLKGIALMQFMLVNTANVSLTTPPGKNNTSILPPKTLHLSNLPLG